MEVMKTRLAALCVALSSLLTHSVLAQASSGVRPADNRRPGDVFGFTNVWAVHLRIAPEQWDAMEPRQGGGPGGGGRRGSFLQGPEGGRNGIAAAFGIVFNYVHADLEFGTNLFKDVGIRYKGNGTFLSSREGLKRSFKIDLNQFVKGQKLAGMSQLNLHNSVRDPAGMNEAMAYRLFREAGVPAPRTAFARVYVTVPGKHERRYFGLYNLVEDVGSSFAEEWYRVKKGAIFKPVTPSLFADLGDDWKAYNQTYDPKGTLSDQQKGRVIEMSKFVSSSADGEFADKVGDYVDLENLARYMAMTAWLSDMDGILGPGQNYYLYLHPDTHKFSFIPWDQDQAFGQFPRGTEQDREQLSIRRPWHGQNPFLERVFKVEKFNATYRSAMREINASVVQPERLGGQVSELAGVLRPGIQDESAERTAEFEKAVAGERVTLSMGPGFSGPVSVKSIKGFVQARVESVADQLNGKSEGRVIRPGFGRP